MSDAAITQSKDAAQADNTETNPTEVRWRTSVRMVMSNRNFRVFLITSWIYSSIQVLGQYYNLYLRDIGITYAGIGTLVSMMILVSLGGTFIAGYLADNFDRRNLAAITMGVNAVGFLVLSMAYDFWTAALGLVVLALSNLTGQGGTAYIMEVIDRRHGGVAMSLFTLGSLFGLGPLFAIALMLGQGLDLVAVIRPVFLFGAFIYALCAFIRVVWLEKTPVPQRERGENVLRDFLSENMRGLRLLVKVFPVFVAVMMMDALSDGFYQYASFFYVNETLDFGFGDINLMLLITLTVSIPLTLYLGQVFDRHGGRRLTIAVYSVMPFAISLLVVAQFTRYIVPQSWVDIVHGIYPGAEVVFSFAFIAVAVKSTNDVLWMTVINAYILKSLPRQEFGKMLGLGVLIIMLAASVGPFISGWIYEVFRNGLPHLLVTISLNITILIVLATKSIEPRVKVEELERGTAVKSEPPPDTAANE